MKRFVIIVCGTGIYIGELILVVVLLSAIRYFFPESSNLLSTSLSYLLYLIGLAAVVLLIIREMVLARKDCANSKDFWFF